MKIFLRVWLKIPDAEAATVKNTLKRRMGFESVLVDLKRERLWSIDVDQQKDPHNLAKRLARELVNENKEWCSTSIDEIQLDPGDYVPVKVALHIEDGEAVTTMNQLRNRLGFDMVRSVERATIWKLYLKTEEPEKLAREIAENLLINPNKDRYEILSKI
jgi:phosphoribosylformylglycinamidine (FGAM) synthase PurS component